MGCILAAFMAVYPRFALFLVWVARPNSVNAAFDTFLVPLAGLILLPFTTLMYVILYKPGGLDGWDWIWVGIAVLCDIAHMGGTYVQQRQPSSGGYPTPWVRG
jgi:hypothetical protein